MKFFLTFVVIASLFSCTSIEIKSDSELCSNQRMPSSEIKKCVQQFEANHLRTYLDRAFASESGLSQATFSNTSGTILKEGPQVPKLNPKQVVSFFAESNSDGTKNRGGVMVQGTPTEIIFDQNGKPAFVLFAKQKVRLLEYTPAFKSDPTKSIEGQGFDRHPAGFGSPLGLLKGWKASIAEYSIHELKNLFEKYTVDGVTTLEFESGITVKGIIEKFIENKSGNYGSPTVITFKSCDVKMGEKFLFHSSSGPYDMILGTMITESNASTDTPTYNPDH